MLTWHRLKTSIRNRFPDRRRFGRELYLSLLEDVLINAIYEDPAIGPRIEGAFNAERRSRGRDWPARAHTMVGKKRLHKLRNLVQRTLDERIPGDYIETGVWRGGCCIMMRGVLAANDERERKVYAADSFAGLPPPNPKMYPVDEGDKHYTRDELVVPLDEVKANFAKYDLLDDQVVFVKGFFRDTLPSLEAGPFALIRLDGDMYESTMQALEVLYPRLSPRGFIVIDDYALKGCRQAVDDYRATHGIVMPIVKIDHTGVWWQKKD
jgi:O-methyltransferase/8-demethyl-8-(2,3-dimethoxy-alpha-L-rhamnosyl)tetracenomycin-C 4'-O-methyltransferase